MKLIRLGWPDAAVAEETLAEEVMRAAAQACTVYAKTHGTGYALTWRLAQEQIQRLLTVTLSFDAEDARSSGFRPVHCEIDAHGALPHRTNFEHVPIRGRWDRVDRHPATGALRVIDYKYRANGKVDAGHQNLLQAALRGFKLQPPLYARMTAISSEQSGDAPEQVDFLYLLPKGDPEIKRASFAASAWQGPAGPSLHETLQALIDGVREGRHFILPGDYCDHCEFSSACRRTHRPTWWRASRSSQSEQLRSLRSLKAPRE